MLDTRRPLLVTADFHARLADELAPLGFAASKKVLVRKRGKASHRIELSSSHHNAEGSVTAWLALIVTDKEIARVEPGYRAGGQLGSPAFYAEPPRNVADPAHADALVALLREKLAFFDLMDDAAALLELARTRYVPGIISPRLLVPYFLVRLGKDAALSYAEALLLGRPELWPAVLGERKRAVAKKDAVSPDHGTELAHSLAAHGLRLELAPGAQTVVSDDLRAANLRCFFGRQLRAWGEAKEAPLLARVADARIHALRAAQEKLTTPLVDDPQSVMLVLEEITRAPKPPRRKSPLPRLFQYHVLHEPWAP